MQAADLFHTGIVVDDLDVARHRLSGLAGYRWGDVIVAPTEVTLADGTNLGIESEFCYSMDVPRLELVRTVPGTPWIPASSGLHHLGYWSDDLVADGAALTAAGYVLELRGGPADGPLFTYHRHPRGERIELLSRGVAPLFEQYWVDGRSPFA